MGEAEEGPREELRAEVGVEEGVHRQSGRCLAGLVEEGQVGEEPELELEAGEERPHEQMVQSRAELVLLPPPPRHRRHYSPPGVPGVQVARRVAEGPSLVKQEVAAHARATMGQDHSHFHRRPTH